MSNLNETTDFNLPNKPKKGGIYAFPIICCLMAFMFAFPYSKDSSRAFSNNSPRIRMSRSTAITLTTTWQTVDYNGTSAFNVNYFPTDPTTGNQLVWWDSTNKLFRFIGNSDTNFQCLWTGATTISLLTSPATLRVRFLVPAGNGYASSFSFPDPDGDGYADVGAVNAATHRVYPFSLPTYTNDQLRKNGVQIQVCLSNALAVGTTITLDRSAILFQATSSF